MHPSDPTTIRPMSKILKVKSSRRENKDLLALVPELQLLISVVYRKNWYEILVAVTSIGQKCETMIVKIN